MEEVNNFLLELRKMDTHLLPLLCLISTEVINIDKCPFKKGM